MAKRVTLAPRLDTAALTALRDQVLACTDDDIVFDGKDVEQLGGLCLELLMSAGTLWPKAGRSVSLEDPSPQMIDDLKRFGLTPATLLESAA